MYTKFILHELLSLLIDRLVLLTCDGSSSASKTHTLPYLSRGSICSIVAAPAQQTTVLAGRTSLERRASIGPGTNVRVKGLPPI